MIRLSPSAVNSSKDERIVIGRVGAPHGIKGLLRVLPLTDFPERFDSLKAVYVKDVLREVSAVEHHGDKLLLCFQGFETREEAARLTGELLSVPRSEAAPLAEGEYYTFDIIGLQVRDTEGNAHGTITQVLKTGSNDVYVAKDASGKELLIPALKKVVKEINVDDGFLLIDPAELAEV
ncbi:ribosome maturation factor RimM [Selenomonas sp. TAMA-11512]|uniref:ribosome maturation factor RimM n=1 Tax=Selenomonas sp. TAMA-11512 TaxID=3095337 RepID=UPI0030D616F5